MDAKRSITAQRHGYRMQWGACVKAGYANGFRGAIATLDALMSQPETSEPDAADDFDYLRP